MMRQEEVMTGQLKSMEQQLEQRLRQQADDHKRQMDIVVARAEELQR